VKSGTPWRLLPDGFPPWKTLYDRHSRRNKRGVREAMAGKPRRLPPPLCYPYRHGQNAVKLLPDNILKCLVKFP